MKEQTFQLSGLTCESCTKLTAKRISKIDGVTEVNVDLKSMVATVAADRYIQTAQLQEVFVGTHYQVEA